jgi:hypothetical protein
MIKTIWVAALAAALSSYSANGLANDCPGVMKVVKDMIDKLDPDKPGQAPKCAAYSEGLGMMKMFRIVSDECVDEGPKRVGTLADLDRSIRRLQGTIDKECGE